MESRRVTVEDVPVLAQVLARSFYDDPVSSFLFPSEKRRDRALARFFAIEIGSMYLPHGEVWTSPELGGCAIWAPPGKHRTRTRDLMKMVPMTPYVIAHPIRCARVLGALETKHPQEPHFYLTTLGTDPPMQGKGIGSAILAPVLERCDAEGIPAYLESSKERNVPFYIRHGFNVTEQFPLPLGGPSVWLMWREPKG